MKRILLCILILSAAAFASPFQYGDIFISSSAGILRYNQAGTLVQTIAGGGGLAFDPAGSLYAAGGSSVRKYDNSGNLVGTFVSGFPGTLGTATDIAFDSAGNAYVAGIQDLNFDFISKYNSAGVITGTASFQQGQENFVFIDAAPNGTLLVTPGSTSVIDKFDAATLAPLGSLYNSTSSANGDVKGFADGGFLISSTAGVKQFNSAGNVVFTYDSATPLHGDFIGVDSFTPTVFFAVSDFGEVRKFNSGTPIAVSAFDIGARASSIEIYTVPEPATLFYCAAGLCLIAFRLRWMAGKRVAGRR